METFPRYWSFVWRIQGQYRALLMFTLMVTWTINWASLVAGDLRRYDIYVTPLVCIGRTANRYYGASILSMLKTNMRVISKHM